MLRAPAILMLCLLALLLIGCGAGTADHASTTPQRRAAASPHVTAAEGGAIDRLLQHATSISQGGPKRQIALTFDDGPGPDTPRLLEILHRLRAPATFFQISRAAQQYPKIAQQELREGYPIGDHTQTHPFLKALTAAAQRREILGAAQRIHAYGATYPRLFRPPFGSFNSATLEITHGAHMLNVLWTVDTRDFSRPGTDRIAYTAISGARPGAIVLMHDGGGNRGQTLAALPRIVRALRRRHFKLVTVPQMLVSDPPRGHIPRAHDLSGR